jgi:8-oxo-dGTP pyrophosphatase MutT (NUDIX family)
MLIVRTAVRALIQDHEGRILIIKRTNTSYCEGWWNLPGGKIDYNQTAEDAVIREIHEETKLECTSSQFLFYLDNLPTPDYETHFLTLFFLCHCRGTIKLNDESGGFYWLGPDELSRYRLAFENDLAIKRFLTHNSNNISND